MPKPPVLCLCADDYAMTPGVSRGILEALEAGALTATSVMTTSPWWPEVAGPLKAFVGRADIGLHLNLTLGAPLAAMPSLAPDGRFPDVRTLMRLDRGRRLPLSEIAAEIERQCDAFFRVFARPPDHVDGHQHVQAIGSIRPLVFDVLAQRGWRPWLRDSGDRPWRIPWRAGRKKAFVLSALALGFATEAQRRGLVCNDGFAGYSRFDPSEDYATLFMSYMNAPGRRHLIMCHPGYIDDALRRLDPVVETREQELRFLLTRLGDVLAARRTALVRLGGG